jgi:hypothetical protein
MTDLIGKQNISGETQEDSGKWIPIEIATFADDVLKAEYEGGEWKAIEKMIEYWKLKHPIEYQSMLVEIDDLKGERGGTASSKKSGLRYLSNIPVEIWNMIKAFYGNKEKIDPFSKEFFREFATRFPEFSVAEKI